jgi:GTP cyclohydrolase I
MVTSALEGAFKTHDVIRDEFLNHISCEALKVSV